MADNSLSDFFLTDSDGDEPDINAEGAPVIIPASQQTPPAATFAQPQQSEPAPRPQVAPGPQPQQVAPAQPQVAAQPVAQPVPQPSPAVPQQPVPPQPSAVAAQPAPPVPVAAPVAAAPVPAPSGAGLHGDREQRLAAALDELMRDSREIQAAALVSLDGFAMASALPEGMQEDRVGAMSAAILGLGERAAAELGRGKLSQVFIQGEGGYVLLTAAGGRAVLTCLADSDAKLGLVLYDMNVAARQMGEILE